MTTGRAEGGKGCKSGRRRSALTASKGSAKSAKVIPISPSQPIGPGVQVIGPGALDTIPKGHGSRAEKAMPLVVEALVNGATIEQAAEAGGVSVPTIFRWQRLASFQDRLAAGRRRQLENGVTGLLALTPKVLTTLADLLDNADPKIQMKAVEVALAQSWKGLEMSDLAGQVERLRGKLKEVSTNGRNSRTALVHQGTEPAARPIRDGEQQNFGVASGGPSDGDDLGEDEARPLAGEVAPLFPSTDADPQLPAEWQVHDGGSARPGGGLA